jgi:predicted ABC-type ATPase
VAVAQLWLLAGGNGAGKSTFHRLYLAPRGLPFVNADVLARELFPDAPQRASYEAARVAEAIRARYLSERRSFCFETVFSHPSKIDFVAEAKALGYEIVLVFVHLGMSELNHARVAQRVSAGGHDVPADKIDQRIPRTLENVAKAIPLCDEVRLLDNSRADRPFEPMATWPTP